MWVTPGQHIVAVDKKQSWPSECGSIKDSTGRL